MINMTIAEKVAPRGFLGVRQLAAAFSGFGAVSLQRRKQACALQGLTVAGR